MSKIKSKILLVINRIIRKTPWYKALWGGADKIFKLNTFGLQVVNTGSGSGVHDFNYDGLPISGFNFALGPQSLGHDYNILKNYFSYFKKGCTVIIPICPFSGMVVKYNKEHNFKYYPMLHPATIENFDEAERTRAYKLYREPIRAINVSFLKKIVRDLLNKFKCKIRCMQRPLNLQESANSFISGWKTQFSITDLSAPISEAHRADVNIRKKTLGDMLEFCKERGFRPIVVMPPMNSSLYRQFPQSFKIQYVNPLIETTVDKECQFIDYTKDERFADDCFYANALFLNQEGAKFFTRHLLMDLKII